MTNPASLEHWFSVFNRKERYHLLVNALANSTGMFEISHDYELKIKEIIKLEKDDYEVVFVAMDYHLDWMHVALQCYKKGRLANDLTSMSNDGKIFKAIQQDVDLLVVFKQEQHYYVVMIEAKADTGWNNKQLLKKAKRLKEIFGDENSSHNYPNVKPFYILSSPKKSDNIDVRHWARWMFNQNENQPYFLKLDLPRCVKVTRKSSESNQLFFIPRDPNS